MKIGSTFASAGAVSRAASTARIVIDAIAIMSRETGQVAPWVNPTIVTAANGSPVKYFQSVEREG